MKRYRKMPIVVEAIQYKGLTDDQELVAFCGPWVSIGLQGPYITTVGGAKPLIKGDWAIKGPAGEYSISKAETFPAEYEELELEEKK